MPSPGISTIIPVLNESSILRDSLRDLRKRAPGAEIIVVDGGSTDGTADLARPECDQFIETLAGRAHQMNAGAAAAKGDVLWFLHVDTVVPGNCMERIRAALND